MSPFWRQALANAAGGLIFAAAGGVGYLCYSVPRQLDQLLQNQKAFGDRFGQIEARIVHDEERIDGLNTRVAHMESR